MTASNTPDQRIDEILDNFGSCLIENLGIAGSDMKLFAHLTKEDVAKEKAALKLLFETMMATALGQDYLVCEKFPTELGTHCNNCFACSVEDNYDFNRGYENKTEEVRQRIPQVLNKYFGGGRE